MTPNQLSHTAETSSLYIGDVPIGKVKFDTVLEYEFISNFKILQGVFNKHRIQKVNLHFLLSSISIINIAIDILDIITSMLYSLFPLKS